MGTKNCSKDSLICRGTLPKHFFFIKYGDFLFGGHTTKSNFHQDSIKGGVQQMVQEKNETGGSGHIFPI